MVHYSRVCKACYESYSQILRHHQENPLLESLKANLRADVSTFESYDKQAVTVFCTKKMVTYLRLSQKLFEMQQGLLEMQLLSWHYQLRYMAMITNQAVQMTLKRHALR